VFDQNGLSLNQAPPIHVVLRFFLVGSLWGIAAGLWLFFSGEHALDPAYPEALILTHMLTLGLLASFMLGALFQMLPVLAGIAIQSPVSLAIRTQYPLIAGTLFLLLGLGQNDTLCYLLASGLLLIGLLPALGMILFRLQQITTHSAASRGMTYAVFHAVILLTLGIMLVGLRSGWWDSSHYLSLRLAHISYGLLGWVTLLIVSVSFQVVEMFYVTPPYPHLLRRWLPSSIAWLLAGTLAAGIVVPSLQYFLLLPAMLLLILHAIITLRRFHQRKRPLTDATVWFWRLAAVSLIISLSGSIVHFMTTTPLWLERLNMIFFLFFSVSVLLAMLYKIVPFLVWFHLNAQGYFSAPMMHEVIHPKYAMKNLWILLTSLIISLAALTLPVLWSPAGGFLALSFVWAALGVYRGWHRYLEVERSGEKFSFPALVP